MVFLLKLEIIHFLRLTTTQYIASWLKNWMANFFVFVSPLCNCLARDEQELNIAFTVLNALMQHQPYTFKNQNLHCLFPLTFSLFQLAIWPATHTSPNQLRPDPNFGKVMFRNIFAWKGDLALIILMFEHLQNKADSWVLARVTKA